MSDGKLRIADRTGKDFDGSIPPYSWGERFCQLSVVNASTQKIGNVVLEEMSGRPVLALAPELVVWKSVVRWDSIPAMTARYFWTKRPSEGEPLEVSLRVGAWRLVDS